MVNVNKMKRERDRGDGDRGRKADIDPSDIVGYDGDRTPEVCAIAYERIEHVTDKAALIVRRGGAKLWVPKSQITDADDENVAVTKWWADKNDVEVDW